MSKRNKNRLEWLFLISSTILFIVLLSSCKTKRTNIQVKENLASEAQNNISKTNSIETMQDLQYSNSKAILEDIKNKHLEEVNLLQIIREYDTEKPIDPKTNKHPICKETINDYRQTKKQSNQTSKQLGEHDITTISKKTFDSSFLYKTSNNKLMHSTQMVIKETNDSYTWYEKILLALGCVCVGFLGFKIYKWIKK